MLEALDHYRNLSPSVLACLLFLLGTVSGSFSSVVYHRLRSGQSVIWPRSHCPHCSHTLGMIDLIPILSFVMMRGRCRHCGDRIHWRYPGLEAGAGGLAALAALTAGPAAGMTSLAVVPASALVLALLHRRKELGRLSRAGVTLVEVLAGVAILGIALMPAFDTITVARRAGRAAEERSVTMSLARARLNLLIALGAGQPVSAIDAYADLTETGDSLSGDAAMAKYELHTTVQAGDLPTLRRVKVTVTCPTCSRLGGVPLSSVTVSTIVEGR